MDKVKDPITLLTFVNTGGLLGLFIYFNKQLEEIRNNQKNLSNNIQTITTKLIEIQKSDSSKNEVLGELSKEVNSLTSAVQGVASLEELEKLSENFNEIVNTLEDHDIKIEVPSPEPPPRRSTARKTSKRAPSKVKKNIKGRKEFSEGEDDLDNLIAQSRS